MRAIAAGSIEMVAINISRLCKPEYRRSRIATMTRGANKPGIGSQPVAERHGWAEMLLGDRKAAARDGQAVLDFVEKEPVTKWNGWYLRFLEAEGQLFEGRNPEASANARSALAMVPLDIKGSRETYARATAAAILAWPGEDDEAVELLEDLSKGYPGIGPAEITR